MSEFKFIVGQEVRVITKDRNLKGGVYKIASRYAHEAGNAYKIIGPGILASLSFFETQLEENK